MAQSLREFITDEPIFDVHEHHMPEGLLNRNVGLVDLLEQSYAGWAHARAFPSPDPSGGTLARASESTWEKVREFVEDCGAATFVRNLVWAIRELYDLGDDWISESNWREVDRAIRERHADPAWVPEVLDRAGIARIVTDPYCDPLMNAREKLGERYISVLRINALAFGWHPDSRDHNGNSAAGFAARLDVPIRSFEDYLDFLPRLLDTMPDRHQVALKNALAYDRTLDFNDVDETLARQAWGKLSPSEIERKAFGDVVIDRLCRLAGERNLPVQMHVGLALIRGSHPLNSAGLIERHPATRFLLMHLAYPFSDDLFGMAFTYPNVWIDLTWSWLISPTRFKRALHEAIEVLCDESRLMLGGDNWHAEETYGSLTLVRRLVADVLEEKVSAGYFGDGDARRLARKILHDNGMDFFGTHQDSRVRSPGITAARPS